MNLVADHSGTLDEMLSRYPIPVFYSTNPWLKFYINEKYRRGKHYIWCSEGFDRSRENIAGTPPIARTSSPRDIYRDLLKDIRSRDWHSLKIAQQKTTLLKLANEWFIAKSINELELEEIVYTLEEKDFSNWRPAIYVIPRHAISANRIQIVKPSDRAGVAREYIIPDLMRPEFDIIEPTDVDGN